MTEDDLLKLIGCVALHNSVNSLHLLHALKSIGVAVMMCEPLKFKSQTHHGK